MKTLKEEIDSLHEIPAFRDFQMAVQRIFQGMTEGTPVEPAIAPPLVTFAEGEK